jgi:hypothetical protein
LSYCLADESSKQLTPLLWRGWEGEGGGGEGGGYM